MKVYYCDQCSREFINEPSIVLFGNVIARDQRGLLSNVKKERHFCGVPCFWRFVSEQGPHHGAPLGLDGGGKDG